MCSSETLAVPGGLSDLGCLQWTPPLMGSSTICRTPVVYVISERLQSAPVPPADSSKFWLAPPVSSDGGWTSV